MSAAKRTKGYSTCPLACRAGLFVWGVGLTASFQIEGGCAEHRGDSIWDAFLRRARAHRRRLPTARYWACDPRRPGARGRRAAGRPRGLCLQVLHRLAAGAAGRVRAARARAGLAFLHPPARRPAARRRRPSPGPRFTTGTCRCRCLTPGWRAGPGHGRALRRVRQGRARRSRRPGPPARIGTPHEALVLRLAGGYVLGPRHAPGDHRPRPGGPGYPSPAARARPRRARAMREQGPRRPPARHRVQPRWLRPRASLGPRTPPASRPLVGSLANGTQRQAPRPAQTRPQGHYPQDVLDLLSPALPEAHPGRRPRSRSPRRWTSCGVNYYSDRAARARRSIRRAAGARRDRCEAPRAAEGLVGRAEGEDVYGDGLAGRRPTGSAGCLSRIGAEAPRCACRSS